MAMWKIAIWFVTVTLLWAVAYHTEKPCKLKKTKYGYVCVNNDQYCDSLDIQDPIGDEYILVTSAKMKDRFVYDMGKFKCCAENASCKTVIEIDRSKTFQEMQGFGGAYTGAVTYLVNRLSPKMRKCFFKSNFCQSSGLSYSYIRVPIGGSDFDLSPWAYNEIPANDVNLSNFTQLDSRDVQRNAQLKEMMSVSKNENIKILGVTWGPPPWMKENNHWNGGTDSQLKKEYYQTWADYHLRWIKLMDKDNMSVWAISSGNEPWAAQFIDFQILSWNSTDQGRWLAHHLVPTLTNSKFKNVRIHAFDENRSAAPDWISGMQNGDSSAFDHVSGLEFHTYSDKALGPEILDEFQAKFPGIQIWYTENSFGAFFMTRHIGPRIGLWERAQKLVKILIKNLSHSVVGFIDWNLILDHKGGPSYANNWIDAQIILSKDMNEMYKNPTFYAMAHFSRFIPAGSLRINAEISGHMSSKLLTIAFLRPDHKVTVIILNTVEKSIDLTVNDEKKGNIFVTLKPKSVNTLVYNVKSKSKCSKSEFKNRKSC